MSGFNTKVLEQANNIKAYRANDNKNKHDDSDSEDGWSEEETKSTPMVAAATVTPSYIRPSVLKPPEVSIFPPPKPNSLNIAPPPSSSINNNSSNTMNHNPHLPPSSPPYQPPVPVPPSINHSISNQNHPPPPPHIIIQSPPLNNNEQQSLLTTTTTGVVSLSSQKDPMRVAELEEEVIELKKKLERSEAKLLSGQSKREIELEEQLQVLQNKNNALKIEKHTLDLSIKVSYN